MRQRVLFVTENITLAQVVRLATLAQHLPRDRYEVHFACSEFDPLVFDGLEVTRWPLFTIDREVGFKALAKGERLYDEKTLGRYVADELRILEQVQPAIVIGDFRLSLAVSAPVAGVHCASLINAYWSPYAVRESWPVPDHPIVRLVGAERAAKYFPQAMPKVFGHFAAPLNALRRRHGLQPFPSLPHQICFGDSVLYADIPELCPLDGAPASHVFLGAVPWSPRAPTPPSLDAGSSDEPLVYVTLGSSGDLAALPTVLAGLADLPVRGVLATAGRAAPKLPANFTAADYLPGDALAERARFVVTNGGSATGYQALAAAVPVLGIPSNLDQYLTMQAIVREGAGIMLRSGGLSQGEVRRAAVRLLDAPAVQRRASELAKQFAAYDCHERFRAWLAAQLALTPSQKVMS